jgi:Ni/Co efflux regulator RcnB
MLYLLRLGVIVLAVIVVLQFVAPRAKAAASRRRQSIARGGTRPGAYEWDRRLDQASRQLKRVAGPTEYRDEIAEWLSVHEGVEAYVEPKTVMHPLSVVFVDGEGEAKRFELKEDAYLRELAKKRGMRVFDASRVGYPDRMRRHPGGGPSA